MHRSLTTRLAAILGTLILTAVAATLGSPAPATAVPADEYVALGDSYSSGNGAYSSNLDSACNRNTYAYPYLVAQARPNTALTFVACSGAKTGDVVSTQSGSLTSSTKYASITIGGNDVGFSTLIVSCVGWSDTTCKYAVDSTNSQIANDLPAKLDAAYAAIRSHAPNLSQVVVLGYGKPFGKNLSCAAAVGINSTKAGWLNGVAQNLDTVISARAAAAGFVYKSNLSTFVKHDVCASDPYLNGTTYTTADTYHPTRSGYANAMAPEVRAVIG